MSKITASKPLRWYEAGTSDCNPNYRHGVYHTPYTIVEISIWPECYELTVIRHCQVYTMKIESPFATSREIKLQAFKFAKKVFLSM